MNDNGNCAEGTSVMSNTQVSRYEWFNQPTRHNDTCLNWPVGDENDQSTAKNANTQHEWALRRLCPGLKTTNPIQDYSAVIIKSLTDHRAQATDIVCHTSVRIRNLTQRHLLSPNVLSTWCIDLYHYRPIILADLVCSSMVALSRLRLPFINLSHRQDIL